MALRAVFLDLDDTLVATSEHDVRAFSHAATVADERAGPLDRERLVADVRAGIKRAPWDPEYVVEVTEWRAALWASALENQGISAGTGGALALGAELQREYDANRMNDFPFMPEVPDAVAHLRKRGLRVVVITTAITSCSATNWPRAPPTSSSPNLKPSSWAVKKSSRVDRRSPTRASSSALATSPGVRQTRLCTSATPSRQTCR